MFLEGFVVFFSILQLNKSLDDGTFERISRRFLWCWLLLLFYPHWRFFVSRLLFYATGTLPWLLSPVKTSTSLSSTLATFACLLLPGFSVTSLSHFTTSFSVLSERFFTHRRFLPCTFSPHIGGFVVQMWAGASHPGFFSMPALIKLSPPVSAWPWSSDFWVTRVFVANSALVSHEV